MASTVETKTVNTPTAESAERSSPESWVERYGDALFRHALFRLNGNKALAEDLVQETLLAAWVGRKEYAGAAREQTWMFGILEHKILDHFRQQKRHPQVYLEDRDGGEDEMEQLLFQADGRWALRPGNWGRNPENLAEDQDLLQAIQRCFEGLPKAQQMAFMHREWYGEDTACCARLLEVSIGHLAVLLHRARLRIARCLEAYFPQGEVHS
ncbi:sigma-70 family RNA polymerase sigma factor [Acidithiobacillus sp. CV18-2]|uniref:Sigma-70 family RNA polymerase sigma factor n=1 Tax=Igneacidithiobacillus copahuensis TaxID=2724909 RepID=A0AAE3CJQ9_9PROT|nr:sigma-70 family RNA polymerase sigma factor [Igneacidithiobacillus copahuensis]MBU2753563.1 sigma-70 family RNA polymerase sigma factor [Acidithiobacillus sp. CV18-3]MBU2757364.1 sigma-70 family RNA polymerase sigma factor [Acidithiobacillus sp. BN09-2]MBU2776057.1 sigma-70 family RNA polymerase sigma factor [Acidithiobacillus sp. CV18-2]MBU2795348.1 sigma-70 family RNA polymerase sigma factor [Acidithiobacillus sp. VAN18-2]MBU2800266.1 sigma-70 family RNA polymerase sigma factor [Acidithio